MELCKEKQRGTSISKANDNASRAYICDVPIKKNVFSNIRSNAVMPPSMECANTERMQVSTNQRLSLAKRAPNCAKLQ